MSIREKFLYCENNLISHMLANVSRQVFHWLDEKVITRGTPDPSVFDVTHTPLTLPRLEASFDGYRLAHISDIHIDTWLGLPRLAQVVELVNAQHPDLIVITGDFVTAVPDEETVTKMGNILRGLRAKDGVLAVLGNHDYWADVRKVRAILETANILEIGNQVHTLQRGIAHLHIAGVDDVYNQRDRLDVILENLPPDGAAILLVHTPDFADVAAETHRFDLCLSGHSHGGQLVIPGLKPFVLPLHGRKYYSGLYRVNSMYQYTTRGLGTSTLAMRWNCPPEISLFTLRSALVSPQLGSVETGG